MKIKEFFTVLTACIVALFIGAIVAIPILIKLELADAAIHYLNRH